MCRREVLDRLSRNRAVSSGANLINGIVYQLSFPTNNINPYVLHYTDQSDGNTQNKKTLKSDLVIGADGANSRIAAIDVGDYNYAVAIHFGDAFVSPKTRWLTMRIWLRCISATMSPSTSTLGFFQNATT